MNKDRLLFRVVCFTALLAFCVVMLGAYTRLKDAGLGCPDWPGCYGHLVVPQGEQAKAVGQAFGNVTVEAPKAWAEMTHRYVAGSLGMLILFIVIRAITTRKKYATPVGLPIIIALIVILQASLGRWTVTLKLLPPIVMFHLLGGMTLTVLLSLLALRLGQFFTNIAAEDYRRFRFWAALGLVLLICQIILGGWTSANYASLACTDFPTCNGALIPELHFSHAFSIMDKIGINYQGGILDQASKVTIQFCHRFGALIVFSYWLLLCLMMLGIARSKAILRFAVVVLILLISQVGLGMMNIILSLPLHVAVCHNAVAALLLTTVVALNYALTPKPLRTDDVN
jgi:cytochrome c oxidase assembly protein subunit 15